MLFELIIVIILSMSLVLLLSSIINVIINLKNNSIKYIEEDNKIINVFEEFTKFIEVYDGKSLTIKNNCIYYNSDLIFEIDDNNIVFIYDDNKKIIFNINFNCNLSYVNSNLVKFNYSNVGYNQTRLFYIGGILIEG